MDQNLGGFTGESRIEYFNRLIEKDRMDLFQLSPESGEMTALSEGLKLFGEDHADRLVYEAVIRDFILASCRENDPYLVLNQLRLHTVLKALNRSTSYQVHFPYRNTRKESHFLEVSFLQDKSTLFLLFRDLSAVSEPVSPESAPYNFTGKRILVADDDEINLAVIEKLLQDKGADVVTVRDGGETVDTFWYDRGRFDLILLDIIMPELNGIETAKQIRATSVLPNSKVIPIIAMTVNVFPEKYEQSLSAGMNAYLLKPIDPVLLYQTIAQYLCVPKK